MQYIKLQYLIILLPMRPLLVSMYTPLSSAGNYLFMTFIELAEYRLWPYFNITWNRFRNKTNQVFVSHVYNLLVNVKRKE